MLSSPGQVSLQELPSSEILRVFPLVDLILSSFPLPIMLMSFLMNSQSSSMNQSSHNLTGLYSTLSTALPTIYKVIIKQRGLSGPPNPLKEYFLTSMALTYIHYITALYENSCMIGKNTHPRIQIMNEQTYSLTNWILRRVFLVRNQLPPFLIYVAHCAEMLLYLPMVYGFHPLQNVLTLNSPSSTAIAFLTLLGILVARVGWGLSLIGFIYPILILNCVSELSSMGLVAGVLVLTALLIAVDVLSNYCFHFSSLSPGSESLNTNKIIHYISFCGGIITTHVFSGLLAHLPPFGLFLLLFFTKSASICKSPNHQALLLRAYLLIVCVHLQLTISEFVGVPVYVEIAVPFVLSQAIYWVYQSLKKKPNFSEWLSQEKYIALGFIISSYIISTDNDPQFEKEIADFMNLNYDQIQRVQVRNELILARMSDILAKGRHFEEQLLLAEVHIHHNHNLLRAKTIIERLKMNLNFTDIFKKVLVLRTEEIIENAYMDRAVEIQFQHYDDYYRCDALRSLMLKAAATHLTLWEYSRKNEVFPDKLRELADRMVKIEHEINNKYDNISHKCISLSILYVSFLYQVTRDVTKGNQLLQALAFNQDFELNFNITQKIFMVFALHGVEPLTISQVSPNINTLLGYERKMIEGQKVEMLLPAFFAKAHRGLTMRLIEGPSSPFYLYTRRTLVRNHYGYYEECNVIFRLHYGLEEDMRLCGFVQVRAGSRYQWNHFLFVSPSGQIIECSQNLDQLAPAANRTHHISEYFEGEYQSGRAQYSREQGHQFHPLASFQCEQGEVTYFVKVGDGVEQLHSQEKVPQMLAKLKAPKLDFGFVKGYFLKKEEILPQLCSREYILWCVFVFVLLGGILACQALTANGTDAEWQRGFQQVEEGVRLYEYFNMSMKVGVQVASVDLRRQYSYQYSLTNDLVDESLALQRTNEAFSHLSVTAYPIPSQLPNITYNKTNYELINDLVANAYMIQLFTSDPFVMDASIKRTRTIMHTVYPTSIGEYYTRYTDQEEKDSDESQSDQKMSSVAMMIGIIFMHVALYLVLIRVEHKMRYQEQQALSLIIAVRNPQPLIDSAKVFIHKVTHEENSYTKAHLQDMGVTIHRQPQGNQAHAHQASKTEVSFRQFSGRNFLEESFGNRSSVMGDKTMRQSEVQPASNAPMEFIYRENELKVASRSRWMLLIPLAIVVLALLLVGIQFYIDNDLHDNDETTIIKLLSLAQPSILYSRSVISFMNLLARKVAEPTSDTVPIRALLSSFPPQQVLTTFEMSRHSSFDRFTALSSEYQYEYLCSFASCDPTFASQIDIITFTVLQKLNTKISTIVSNIDTYNSTSLGVELGTNGSMKAELDLLLYTERLVREWVGGLVQAYEAGFRDFASQAKKTANIVENLLWGISGVACVIMIGVSIFVGWNLWTLSHIVQLLKTNSYIQDADELEEERPHDSQVANKKQEEGSSDKELDDAEDFEVEDEIVEEETNGVPTIRPTQSNIGGSQLLSSF